MKRRHPEQKGIVCRDDTPARRGMNYGGTLSKHYVTVVNRNLARENEYRCIVEKPVKRCHTVGKTKFREDMKKLLRRPGDV